MNSIIITGNATADSKTFYKDDGRATTTFTVATNDTSGEKVFTEFHRVVVFGKQADYLAGSIKKGMRICVIGKVTSKKYNDKDGVERQSFNVMAFEVYQGFSKKEDPVIEDDMPF